MPIGQIGVTSLSDVKSSVLTLFWTEKNMEVEDKVYGLLHWEDDYRSIISLDTVISPRTAVNAYNEGQKIVARFKSKLYSAVISSKSKYIALLGSFWYYKFCSLTRD